MRAYPNRSAAASSATVLAVALILLLPAFYNGFPLLFYDSGAYFMRAIDLDLSPGRSAVYGFYLALLRFPFFWPAALAQCTIAAWIIFLVLRAEGFGRPLVVAGAGLVLALATSLPWLGGQLMPDLFAGLSVLALYLLIFRFDSLHIAERIGLIALIAFSCAIHNATFAMLTVLLLAAAACSAARFFKMSLKGIAGAAAGVILGVLLLLGTNFALTGKLAWTQGGVSFVFGRMLQDGIVDRYLADHCPDKRILLCRFKHKLPPTGDDFLWHEREGGAFFALGAFDDERGEMARITRETLVKYPSLHIATALRSTFKQLVMFRTGDGIVPSVWDAYGAIEREAPEMIPASHSALQRTGKLPFATINLFHVPLGALSLLALPLLIGIGLWKNQTALTQLATTASAAILANAFICGVLSGPHDRYGARIVWIASFTLLIAGARAFELLRGPLSAPAVQPSLVKAVRREGEPY